MDWETKEWTQLPNPVKKRMGSVCGTVGESEFLVIGGFGGPNR